MTRWGRKHFGLTMKAKILHKTPLAWGLAGWERWGAAAPTHSGGCGADWPAPSCLPPCMCGMERPAPTLQRFCLSCRTRAMCLVVEDLLCICTTSAGPRQRMQRTGLNFPNSYAFPGVAAPCCDARAVLQGWQLPLLSETRANFAAISRESCRNSSGYTISKRTSVNLISYFSCLLHVSSIGSLCREDWTIYFAG